MRDLEQLVFLRQFLGGGQAWLQVAFLLCLFAVRLFRPERIRFPGLFRWAVLLFALSVVVPHVLTFSLAFLQFINDDYSAMSGRGANSLLVTLQSASGPVLLGVSLILAFEALSPGLSSRRRISPTKHPLE